MKNDKRKTSPIASLTGVGFKTRSRIRVKSTFPLISGRGKEFNQMFVLQYLGCSRSWTSCSSDPEWILVEGQSLSVLNKVRSSLLGRFQTGLQGGGIPYKDFRFASLSNPIFSSGWILRFLIPVVKRKKPKTKHHQQPAFPTRKEFLCVHYPWSGLTILNLLFSISPFVCLRLLPAGKGWLIKWWISLKTTKVAFIQSKLLCPSTNDSLWKGRNAGNKSFLSTGSWKLSMPASPIWILPLASVLHQIMSPYANFLFYWRPIAIRLSRKPTKA